MLAQNESCKRIFQSALQSRSFLQTILLRRHLVKFEFKVFVRGYNVPYNLKRVAELHVERYGWNLTL